MDLLSIELESLSVGAQPILSQFIERLQLQRFLELALSNDDPRLMLPTVPTVLALLRNVALSRQPLYAVHDWLHRFVPDALQLSQDQLALVNDDRLGRVLDRLFRADLSSLQTRIIVQAVQTFGIQLKELHNDSTTITFSGAYENQPSSPVSHGKAPPRITHGHNKDHRPDLKQLVFSLSITADGNVPVHYSLLDGNTSDDQTHIHTWNILQSLRDSPDFIYVADSKLCTRKNMAHIAENNGTFITVLPRTRSEDGWFKDYLQTHPPVFIEILRRPNSRRKDEAPEVFEVAEETRQTSEGYLLYWYRSSTKLEADRLYRQNCLDRAIKGLSGLAESPGWRRFKTSDEALAAADAVVAESRAGRWVRPTVTARVESSYKQTKRGRPGPNTAYSRIDTEVFDLSWTFVAENLQYDARTDGLFPLVTNRETLSALEVLELYKRQAPLEKRHKQFKQVLEIMPVNLKTPSRVEAFVFVYFLAQLLHGLVERELRAAMKKEGVPSLALYPEERACSHPTAEKVLEKFEDLRRHRLMLRTKPVKVFWDPLTEVQEQVLRLLQIPPSSYGVRNSGTGTRSYPRRDKAK